MNISMNRLARRETYQQDKEKGDEMQKKSKYTWVCEDCGANLEVGETHKRSCASLKTLHRLLGMIPDRAPALETQAWDSNTKDWH